jgi:hypothetical protein
MRLLLGAGLVLALASAACKDAATPVDFTDPVAISANLSSVDSAISGDVYRSFGATTLELSVATSPALRPVSALLASTRPGLQRSGAQAFLPGVLSARQLQLALPNLSVAAALGRIIPDSMYGRVFEWDTTLNTYTYQGHTVTGLTGVRFVLYARGLDGAVVEPVSAIGTLDIIDQSTVSKLQLQVLVQGPGNTPTYVDYTASVQPNGATSATATASGSISNGLDGASNKTLSFNETATVNANGVNMQATFALNNPAITLLMNESVAYSSPNLVINADFKLIQNGVTIEAVGQVNFNTGTGVSTVNVTVKQDGHPVASISGDPSNPGTQWKDAGGNPLTADDLAALGHLFDAFESFQEAVTGLFAPVTTFASV